MRDFHGVLGAPRLSWSWRAIATSVGLSLLFLVVYNCCNHISGMRRDVGQWFFQWEDMIPFVPLMIIPYMSIDLFFALAPFLIRDGEARRVFRRRVMYGILVAGLCFLAFPLKLGFARPHVEGWLGAIFNPFTQMDLPYNLLPSLHITLRTILASVYARCTKGLCHLASLIWFSLIGFSTVLTKQHHVVDVAGGFVLALLLFHCFSTEPLAKPVLPNRRVGICYGVGAGLCLAGAWLLKPAGLMLLWPAASLGMVCAGYFHLGPGIFRKRDGRIPWTARLALWPIILGQELSLLWYSHQCHPWDEIHKGIFVGRVLAGEEAAKAKAAGVKAVIDLTGEFSENEIFLKLPYLNLQVLDLTAPSSEQVAEAIAFIDKHRPEGAIYIHCKIGYSRSAAIAGAWLLAHGHAENVPDAIDQLKAARTNIVIRPEIRELLNSLDVMNDAPGDAGRAAPARASRLPAGPP